MKKETALLWFRRDFRLDDNAALHCAIESGAFVIPVFIWSPDEEAPWQPGGAARVWIHHSLSELASVLQTKGSDLLIEKGNRLETIVHLARECNSRQVFANSIYEPKWLEQDEKLQKQLAKEGIELRLSAGELMHDPFAIRTGQDKPFQVFTPYWRAAMLKDPSPGEPLTEPEKIRSPEKFPSGVKLAKLELLPKIKWETGIIEAWLPGLNGARINLDLFVEEIVADYADSRDLPYMQGTSRLSPYLHFGEISPRRVWQTVVENLDKTTSLRKNSKKVQGMKAKNSGEVYLRELGWREFAHEVLCNFPKTDSQPLRSEFNHFPWSKSKKHLKAWQKGQTGYPLIDAGMRELWYTGWMHNRVRMVVASFLVKHLLLPWQDGASWFWDTLVDADLANNSLGWQWSAGCGADAAPYFRIFNPILQGEKFDPEGKYIRKWVPELEALPDKYIHKPWTTPPLILKNAGIELGTTYPHPIVDHDAARKHALAALQKMRTR